MRRTIHKKQTGFTIVELLIVIVVIGILAAITIVSYNGIQSKARSAQLLSTIDAYEKAIRMYAVDHDGKTPAITDGTSIASQGCLGDQYPQVGVYSTDECYRLTNPAGDLITTLSASAQLNNALKPYLGKSLPAPNYSFKVSDDSVTVNQRGLVYMSASDGSAYIVYYIDGDQTCGRGAKYTGSANGVTLTYCQTTISQQS